MVRRVGPHLVPAVNFKLEFMNSLITASILADIPLSFARNPIAWLSQLKTNVPETPEASCHGHQQDIGDDPSICSTS